MIKEPLINASMSAHSPAGCSRAVACPRASAGVFQLLVRRSLAALPAILKIIKFYLFKTVFMQFYRNTFSVT